MTKKKIFHDVLLKIDDNIEDVNFQNVLNSGLQPLQTETKEDGTIQYKSVPWLAAEDTAAMSLLLHKTTSKKDRRVRAVELFKIVQKPLEMFYEERLSYQLLD